MNSNPSLYLKVDPIAAQQIEMMRKAHPGYLKIIIGSGGCSGFSVEFDWVESPENNDIVIENLVCIHPDDLAFIGPSRLMYEKTLMRAEFGLKVEMAANSCGCGKSFSI